MSVLERPRLRSYLAAAPENRDRVHYLIWDSLRLSSAVLKVTALQMEWLQLFDGERTLVEIQAEAIRHIGGYLVPLEVFERMASDLDQRTVPRWAAFQERASNPIRQPCCVHQYETHPGALTAVVEELFTRPGGPGLPGEPDPDDRLRAVLIPHIDYGRGGSSYAWAFKEVFERTPAALFVIIGTSHYSRHRFTLTRKHFQTPLGITETDQDYIDRLVHHYGPGLFDDELGAHLPEHSIELEVVFLQYYYSSRRPIRIVPLVVGSFHDCVGHKQPPAQAADIGRMIQALRAVEQETAEPICYLISGDLAHIGPKFGDAQSGERAAARPQPGAGQGHPAPDRGSRPGRVLPGDRRRGGPAAHLRLAADLHGAGSVSSDARQGPGLRSVRPSAGPGKRQFRQRRLRALMRHTSPGWDEVSWR